MPIRKTTYHAGSVCYGLSLDFAGDQMAEKPTYQKLEQRLRELEKEAELRRHAEASLRKNEERYRALFENNPVETVTVDREGRVTEFNQARRTAGRRPPKLGDVMYKDYASGHQIDMHNELMECIRLGQSRKYPEMRYKDEYLSINISSFHGGAIITSSDITQRKQAEEERERLINELQQALAKVKRLSGLLPICSSCKKIRDDSGYWKQIEAYIREHSEAEFSHGVCPECARRLYPEIFECP